jgi:Na+/H+ antiporter NhaC|tara:strand:- start:3725 stop:5209 length:1485 start_codon:yes stop_codon:yes gene_type:complete
MAEFIPLIPPLVALVLILITRQAALSLFAATIAGAFLLAGPSPILAIRCLFEDHLFPKIGKSSWNLSAIIFTFTLGAFATLLEKGGGFTTILNRLLAKEGRDPKKKLLFGVYGLGLLCFFDGLANAVLLGRVARPLTDTLRISRQFLAYVIDSTSATVACVAFISTWIATQLSFIKDNLVDAPFEVNPAALFFNSIPANPYCLLSLLLIPLVIFKAWHLGPMKNAQPVPLDDSHNMPEAGSPFLALIPLAILVLTLPAFIYLWQDGSDWSWQNAFTSDGVPYAMVAAGFVALAAAYLCFPKRRRKEAPQHMLDGAASLFPALIILICAWTLGSMFNSLGTADLLAQMLGDEISPLSVPLVIFLIGAVMSFMTGTSWGTFGLLMPMALPLVLRLGADLPEAELMNLISMTIGAVFGGAVFGDHCSPFSDTTIVSALASGCSPTSHVATQLPYALITATGAAAAYTLMWVGISSWLSTLIIAALLTALVLARKSKS